MLSAPQQQVSAPTPAPAPNLPQPCYPQRRPQSHDTSSQSTGTSGPPSQIVIIQPPDGGSQV
eukprot:13336951-Ditylum_brightwellii.AAC.1